MEVHAAICEVADSRRGQGLLDTCSMKACLVTAALEAACLASYPSQSCTASSERSNSCS